MTNGDLWDDESVAYTHDEDKGISLFQVIVQNWKNRQATSKDGNNLGEVGARHYMEEAAVRYQTAFRREVEKRYNILESHPSRSPEEAGEMVESELEKISEKVFKEWEIKTIVELQTIYNNNKKFTFTK